MSQRRYNLDITGLNPDNLVTETRTLTNKLIDGRFFIIPQYAPFYVTGCKITDSNGVLLVAGRDYAFMLDSPELSQAAQRRICGGIVFTNRTMNPRVTIEFQTIGGNYIVPLANNYEQLVRDLRNPLFTTLSQIHGTPAGLPTYQHTHDIASVKSYDDLVGALNNVYSVLLGRSSGSGGGSATASMTALTEHINSKTNAHHKSAVGLSEVANLPVMNNADWDKALPTDAYITRSNLVYWGKINITDKLSKVEENIVDIDNTISNHTLSISQINDAISDVVGDIVGLRSGFAANLSAIAGLRDSVATYTTEVRALREELTFNQSSIVRLIGLVDPNSVNNYDNLETDKVFFAGTHTVRLKPKSRFLLTLVGGGGGCGEQIIDGEHSFGHYGGNGGDSFAYTYKDLADGTPVKDSIPLMKACGGRGCGSTYVGLNNAITSHGVGGKGGYTLVKTGVTPITNTAGRDGLNGSGDVTTEDHNLVGGFTYNDTKYGAGASAKRHIPQGGSGGIIAGHIINNTTEVIELVVVVGGAGNSTRHEFNNSTSGIAIIKMVS